MVLRPRLRPDIKKPVKIKKPRTASALDLIKDRSEIEDESKYKKDRRSLKRP